MSDKQADQTVVYRFTPANEGEFLAGIPARDLTALDVANLTRDQLRDMLSPSPRGAHPMYTPSKAENEAAEDARATQAAVAPKPADDKPKS